MGIDSLIRIIELIIKRDLMYFEGRQRCRNCFVPSEKRCSLLRKNMHLEGVNSFLIQQIPFEKGLNVQLSKPEVTKSVSIGQMAKIYQVYLDPLNII